MKRPVRAIAIGVVSLLVSASPLVAAAQASMQTVQLLPPGGNGCGILLTQGIAAHASNGQLHSFDVTVGDMAYVAVSAQVGTQLVPFHQITRFREGGNFIKHHVDINPIFLGSGVPISLTLLSSPPGMPTCLTVVSFMVTPSGSVAAPGFMSAPTPSPAPSVPTPTKPAASKPQAPKPATVTKATTSPVTTSKPTVIGETVGKLQGLCTGAGATQLWFLLLAVYVVLAALVALAKPPLAEKSVWIPLAAILAPLVLLLALWYFAPSCRTAGWVPAASLVIAIAALLVAFREQNPAIKVIPLPAAKGSSTPPTTKAIQTTENKSSQGPAKGR